ncbi:MAG: polymer-forming cytoskeletal protein [Saprospiraceae bacterium]|jgi:cytoskeletal protein CcmA (bactofilin family)|nr:polymer-forming cytoskeletal protein [Saprospiraceae bacterium]
MFGNKNDKSTPSNGVQAASNVSNSIVEGTKIEGNIFAANDIRIDGELTGKLDCKGRVIIGPQGRVDGDVQCTNAIIEGHFTGNINVKELLAVKESAVVNGDINTDKLMVQTGAVFNVTCSMGGQKLKPLLQKEAKTAN